MRLSDRVERRKTEVARPAREPTRGATGPGKRAQGTAATRPEPTDASR